LKTEKPIGSGRRAGGGLGKEIKAGIGAAGSTSKVAGLELPPRELIKRAGALGRVSAAELKSDACEEKQENQG